MRCKCFKQNSTTTSALFWFLLDFARCALLIRNLFRCFGKAGSPAPRSNLIEKLGNDDVG